MRAALTRLRPSLSISPHYMSQYIFQITLDGAVVQTFNCRELNNLAAAHQHAMLIIYKMMSLDDMDWRGWSIKVSDASNCSVLSVIFPHRLRTPLGQRWRSTI